MNETHVNIQPVTITTVFHTSENSPPTVQPSSHLQSAALPVHVIQLHTPNVSAHTRSLNHQNVSMPVGHKALYTSPYLQPEIPFIQIINIVQVSDLQVDRPFPADRPIYLMTASWLSNLSPMTAFHPRRRDMEAGLLMAADATGPTYLHAASCSSTNTLVESV